jgi:hypothetical protein
LPETQLDSKAPDARRAASTPGFMASRRVMSR